MLKYLFPVKNLLNVVMHLLVALVVQQLIVQELQGFALVIALYIHNLRQVIELLVEL